MTEGVKRIREALRKCEREQMYHSHLVSQRSNKLYIRRNRRRWAVVLWHPDPDTDGVTGSDAGPQSGQILIPRKPESGHGHPVRDLASKPVSWVLRLLGKREIDWR